MTPQEGKTAPTPSEGDSEAAEKYSGLEFIRWCNNRQPSLAGAKAHELRDAFMAGAAHKEKQLAEALARARAEAFKEAALIAHENLRLNTANLRVEIFRTKAQQAPGEDG
jgi:heterodisulfide reductase subunit A-like polyferredoxin